MDGDLVAGRYEVVDFLNEGGMQEVYVADDRTLQRRVALKVPKSSGAARRFDRSARLSARIVHPSVAATFDYVDFNNNSYLVEELVAGTDLRARLDTEFFYLDPHLAAHVITHLVRAVAAAHHVGVCHRDLKPSNIIVSPDPSLTVVKITDFGIAKMAESELADGIDNWEKDESTVTGSKTLVGAIPYMAPEQFKSPRQVVLASDIWAVGAILYHLLSGAPPFGRGPAAIAGILDDKSQPSKPPLFGKKPSFQEIENNLWDVIASCLLKDPKRRPTADQLVAKTSELCFSNAPRQTGTISKFRDKGGDWGFISTAGQNVFMHASSFYGTSPKEGMRVNFAPHDGSPCPRAAPAIPLRA